MGTIASYWTEVPLPATGTWNAPGKGGAQADIVLTAPQDRVPLLFIEVDNCHETAEELADKLQKYVRFFLRKVEDTDGRERSMWRTRWRAPDTWSGDAPFPPVLLVFNRLGERNPNRTVPRLMELTRHLWQGQRQKGGHHHYDGRLPIIATGLNQLREHGPVGAVFLRFGRDHKQHLWEAIGNPRREAADARARVEARARQEEYQAQVRRAAQEQAAKQAAEREARRPVCTGCGAKFTDERWKATSHVGWSHSPAKRPSLCGDCDRRFESGLERTRGVNHRQEQRDQEQDQAVPKQKAGGTWLPRFRR